MRSGNSTQAAEPEGEGERRAADETVVRRRPAGTCAAKQSQIASTSRWKCIVPFGSPVVPEVKAIRQTSSAAVSTAAKVAGWPRHRRFERVGAVVVPVADALAGRGCAGCALVQLLGQAPVAERDG